MPCSRESLATLTFRQLAEWAPTKDACRHLASIFLPATGGIAPIMFRFHSAEKSVRMVHAVENSMLLKPLDRRYRLAMTMADGAIQGPGSVGFEEEEAKVDKRHGLPVGVCQFHRLDNAGSHADRQFPITLVYDRFLRLLRRSFGFGTGVLILRATAREFDRLAGVLEADAAKYSTRAAEAEAAGRLLAAQRHKVARARAASHAMAFRRAGWTEFRQPLAPRADGTRKVVWQSAARRRLFEIFALIYWGLKIRICEAKEAARIEAQRGGRRPASGGHDVGNNNKQVRAWRALGRTLCDIQLLVFNIGRADFRRKFVEPFTIMIQTSSSNAMGVQEVGLTASMHMTRARAALTDARGIIMILDKIMIVASGANAAASGANAATPAPPRNSRLKTYHLWAFTRTQLAHRCWCLFPGLVIHLPHVLLGGFKVGTLMSLGAVGLQHKSAGRCRLCCVHKGLQRFCQHSICCWNGPRQSAAIVNKRCWVQNLWAMRENIRKRPYAMGHGH